MMADIHLWQFRTLYELSGAVQHAIGGYLFPVLHDRVEERELRCDG